MLPSSNVAMNCASNGIDRAIGENRLSVMKTLRVVDQRGNRYDFETDFVPRIGERVLLLHRRGDVPSADHVRGGETAAPHHFRVVDVLYRLDNSVEHQAAILVEEETKPEAWPELPA